MKLKLVPVFEFISANGSSARFLGYDKNSNQLYAQDTATL